MSNFNLKHFKKVLKGSNIPFALLSRNRDSIPAKYYEELIQWINNNPQIRNKVFHQNYPVDIAELKAMSPLDPIGEVKEFEWVIEYIKPHFEKIADFIDVSEKFQENLLSENYNSCKEALAEVETKFGQSIWLIKNTAVFLQVSKGLEAQKAYISNIRKNALQSGITAYVAHYVSMRNESAVTVNRFHDIINDHFSKLRVPDGMVSYLRYHIYPTTDLSLSEIAAILRFENYGNVVDIYESVLFATLAAIANNLDLFSIRARTNIRELISKIGDPRLKVAANIFGESVKISSSLNNYLNDINNSILEGQYDKALELTADALRAHRCNFDILETAAKLYETLGKDDNELKQSLSNGFLLKLLSVVRKGDNFEKDVSDLIKLALNSNACSWSYDLMRFIDGELSPNIVSYNTMNYISVLSNPIISLHKVKEIYNIEVKKKYIDQYEKAFPDSVSTKFIKSFMDYNSDRISEYCLHSQEATIMAAEIEYYRQSYEAALGVLANANLGDSKYNQMRAKRLIANCNLKLGNIQKCLHIIVNEVLNDSRMNHVMPLEACMDAIDRELYRKLKSDITLAIAYEMFSKYIGNRFDSLKAYAYEDFLLSNGLEKPSDLRSVADKFDKKSLLYYLRFLCIESTMDRSVVFKGSKDILEERLAVCKLIADSTEQPDELLQTEIKDILKRLMVHRRMREIEQSKIYIDLDSIRKTVDKTLRESYARYLSMLKLHMDQEMEDAHDKIKAGVSEGDLASLASLTLPKNEMADLLQEMVLNLRDEFISSAEHGLDGYLSVRIRHGTLVSQLRSPLESAHLITKRNSETGAYYTNEYWTNKLGIDCKDDNLKSIDELFAKFSAGFDELVNQICSEWIQIKKEKNDKRLFDFTVYKVELINLSQRISEETSFESFLDTVFEYFYQLLEESLKDVRAVFRTDVKNRINKLMDELQAGFEQNRDSCDSGEINNIIRLTRTEMQAVVDRVIEWFRLSKTTATDPFTLEDVITISVESIKAYARSFDIEVVMEQDMPQISAQGKFLTSIVDILFIIFENIVRHAGRTISPRANIRASYSANMINIRIENPITSEAATASNRIRVSNIKSTMTAGKFKAAVKKEGGTGFHKIRKILNHDFVATTKLDFGFINDTSFYVEFTLPAMEVAE